MDKAQWVNAADMSQPAMNEWNDWQRHRHLKGTTALMKTNLVLNTWKSAMSSSCLSAHVDSSKPREADKTHDDLPFKYEVVIHREGITRQRPVLYIYRMTKPFERNYEYME